MLAVPGIQLGWRVAETDDNRNGRSRLPSSVVEALRRPPGDVVALVATVDDDGAPRTATFGAMRPISPTRLRFACRRETTTCRNIRRDGRVMVATYRPPDVAVGISGRAHVLRESMDTLPESVVVQVDVVEVKTDHLESVPIASGVTYDLSPDLAAHLEAANTELETV